MESLQPPPLKFEMITDYERAPQVASQPSGADEKIQQIVKFSDSAEVSPAWALNKTESALVVASNEIASKLFEHLCKNDTINSFVIGPASLLTLQAIIYEALEEKLPVPVAAKPSRNCPCPFDFLAFVKQCFTVTPPAVISEKMKMQQLFRWPINEAEKLHSSLATLSAPRRSDAFTAAWKSFSAILTRQEVTQFSFCERLAKVHQVAFIQIGENKPVAHVNKELEKHAVSIEESTALSHHDLIFCNFISFDTPWKYSLTPTIEDFTCANGTTVTTAFMASEHEPLRVVVNKQFYLVEKEFDSRGEPLSFVMAVPNSVDDFLQMKMALNEQNVNTMIAQLKATTPRRCSLKMPQLKIETQMDLRTLLAECHFPLDKLNKFEAANRVDLCLHRCFITIRENGKRESKKALPAEDLFSVEATKAFCFFILRNNQILVQGAVTDEAFLTVSYIQDSFRISKKKEQIEQPLIRQPHPQDFISKMKSIEFDSVEQQKRLMLFVEPINSHFINLENKMTQLKTCFLEKFVRVKDQFSVVNFSEYDVVVDGDKKLLINLLRSVKEENNEMELQFDDGDYAIFVLPSSELGQIHLYQADSKNQITYRRFDSCDFIPLQSYQESISY